MGDETKKLADAVEQLEERVHEAETKVAVGVAVLEERVKHFGEALMDVGMKVDIMTERVSEWAESSKKGHGDIEKRLKALEETINTAKNAGGWLIKKSPWIGGSVLAGGVFFGDWLKRLAVWVASLGQK